MNRRSWLLMGLLAALWGASYLFIKVDLDDGLDPIFIVFARIALGAAVLVPIAIRWGAMGAIRGRWGAIAFMAIVQVVVPFLLITYGEQHIASSLAGILVASAPIFTALIAARFDAEERPRGVAAAGVVLGIFGVVLLFGVDLSGDAAALPRPHGPARLVRLRGRRALPQAPPARRAGGRDRRVDAHRRDARAACPRLRSRSRRRCRARRPIGSLLLLGAGGTGIAFLIFYTLIADIGPSRAALVAYIAPGFAVLYGVWLLDEPLTAGAVVGLALILAGSWIAAEGRLPGQARVMPAAPLEPPPVREAA